MTRAKYKKLLLTVLRDSLQLYCHAHNRSLYKCFQLRTCDATDYSSVQRIPSMVSKYDWGHGVCERRVQELLYDTC